MIQQMDQKINEFNFQNASTLWFVFEKEVNTDINVDYIFMSQVLLHIKDTSLILSRLYDILNESGHLIIVDFNKNEAVSSDMVHNGFKQEDLTHLMTTIGFKEIESKTFYNGTNIFMNQDASLFVLDAKKINL